MSHTTDGRDSRRALKKKDGISGKSGGTDESSRKKVPWTAAEDAILISYVRRCGPRDWNTVRIRTELQRTGKSCRLRWINHLRSDLKKGGLNPEEQATVIKLHEQLGNKWARISKYLPGRTDNEIKNFWNTRMKKHKRHGIRHYPVNIGVQHLSEKRNDINDKLWVGKQYNQIQPDDGFGVPNFLQDDFKMNTMMISPSSIPHSMSSMNPTSQYLANSGSCLPTPDSFKSCAPFDYLSSGYYSGIGQSFSSSIPCDPQFSSLPSPVGSVVPASHGSINGNFSTSQTLQEPMKLELPSLQYSETDLNGWLHCSSTSALISGDYNVKIPENTVSMPSEHFLSSLGDDGLLDTVVHSRNVGINQSLERGLCSSGIGASWSDQIGSSATFRGGKKLDACGHNVSHLGCGFDHMHPTNRNLCDRCRPCHTSGLNEKSEATLASTSTDVKKREVCRKVLTNFEASNESSWHSNSIMNEVVSLLLEAFHEGNLYGELSNGVLGHDLFAWDNMPPACYISD